MQIRTIFILLILAIVTYSFTRLQLVSPEDLLIGEWSERTWTYERVPVDGERIATERDELTNTTKSYLGKGLLLHENELWRFLPGGKLQIVSACGELQTFYWCLKGKGDVLLIKDQSHQLLEHYKITHIDQDALSLNFELDIQVKGLACLTFKKNQR